MLQPRRKPTAVYGKRGKAAPVRSLVSSSSESEDDKENARPAAAPRPRIALQVHEDTPRPVKEVATRRMVVAETDDEEESRQIAELLATPPPGRPASKILKPRSVVKPSPLRPAVIQPRRRLKSPQPPIKPPVIDVDVSEASDGSIEEINAVDFLSSRSRRRPEASSSKSPAYSSHDFSPAITPLLDFCGQTAPYDFASLAGNASSSLGFSSPTVWRKLGEATYSEVFTVAAKSNKPASLADALVAKIIPLRTHPAPSEYTTDDEDSDELPEETDWSDALRELRTTRLLGDDARTPGFVQLKK